MMVNVCKYAIHGVSGRSEGSSRAEPQVRWDWGGCHCRVQVPYLRFGTTGSLGFADTERIRPSERFFGETPHRLVGQ